MKLKQNKLLSNVAFNSTLRPSSKAMFIKDMKERMVGRCRVPLP